MGEADNESAARDGADADAPLTVELLADLQAGLLDDDSAARVRKRVRDDPGAQAILRVLNQVRCDVATLGADPTSAPDVPPEVTARVTAALGTAGYPTRAAGRRRGRRGGGAGGDRLGHRGADQRTGAHAQHPRDRRAHHGVHAPTRDSAVAGGDRWLASPEPGLRPPGRSGAPRLLPQWPRVSGIHAGAGRATDRDQRPSRGAPDPARRHAREPDGVRGGPELQCGRYRVIGQHAGATPLGALSVVSNTREHPRLPWRS